MNRVAAVSFVALAALAAATFIARGVHERTVALDQLRTEQVRLAGQLGRIEQMLAVALKREATDTATPLPAPSAQEDSGSRAPIKPTDSERDDPQARDALLEAGNAVVDRAIASGVWRLSDFDAFVAATRGLSAEENGRIMARLSAAINANQVRIDIA